MRKTIFYIIFGIVVLLTIGVFAFGNNFGSIVSGDAMSLNNNALLTFSKPILITILLFMLAIMLSIGTAENKRPRRVLSPQSELRLRRLFRHRGRLKSAVPRNSRHTQISRV